MNRPLSFRAHGVQTVLDRMDRHPERNVSVRQMRAFVAIGRLKSFTQAAALLHSTQPALSARIRELEIALDLRLFDRNTRSVRLTQAGEDLLPVVAQVLADLGSLLERAKDVATRNTGRVTIAALPSISSELLPATVARFARRYPGVSIGMRDAVADRVLELVRNREVDFGVTSVGGGDPKLDFTPLLFDRIVAVLAALPSARASAQALARRAGRASADPDGPRQQRPAHRGRDLCRGGSDAGAGVRGHVHGHGGRSRTGRTRRDAAAVIRARGANRHRSCRARHPPSGPRAVGRRAAPQGSVVVAPGRGVRRGTGRRSPSEATAPAQPTLRKRNAPGRSRQGRLRLRS